MSPGPSARVFEAAVETMLTVLAWLGVATDSALDEIILGLESFAPGNAEHPMVKRESSEINSAVLWLLTGLIMGWQIAYWGCLIQIEISKNTLILR